nr:hypothetical protein [Allomuricauda sp.]
MKKIYLLALLVLVVFNGSSQVKYEKGFFVNNLGERIDCLIRYVDWNNNPTEIQYKLQTDAEPMRGSLETIAEFSILDKVKYVRFDGLIDRSESKVANLSSSKEPAFNKEKLFLKELIGGQASLYSYTDSKLQRFFFSIDGSEIKQLIYKKYLDEDNGIRENSTYKKELWENLKCSDISLEEVQSTDYKKKELTAIFNEFNSCIDPNYVSKSANEGRKKDWFKFGIRGGATFASVRVNSVNDFVDVRFEDQTNFRFGVELEAILPFNRNKWSVILQPTFQSYKAEEQLTNQTVTVDYKSIEFSLGFRHYMFLSKDLQLFLSSSLILDAPIDSNIDYELTTDFPIEFRSGASFGLGFKIAKRYSIEAIYALDRSVIGNFGTVSANYSSSSIVLGYTFL